MPSKKLTQKLSKNIFLSVIYFNRGIWVLFFYFSLKISYKKNKFHFISIFNNICQVVNFIETPSYTCVLTKHATSLV